MRRFLIDVDTASDDAVALVMALHQDDIEVEAVTVVAGNVPLAQGVQNALYTIELCGKHTPVYAGLAAPLQRPLRTAQFVHGQDGMSDIGLPLHGRTPAAGHAVDVIRQTLHRYPGEMTLVTLGPLTNVAMALLLDPSLAGLVKEHVMMGGTGQGYGNVTPVAEYNIWVDPEAARIVYASGMPITMVGWDISRQWATFSPEQAKAWRNVGTPLAKFCVDIQKKLQEFAVTNKLPGFDLADPITMAVAIDPATIVEEAPLFVDVETAGNLCQGQTVVDHLGRTGNPPNSKVVVKASRQRFLEILYASVGGKYNPHEAGTPLPS
jgi:purine nucleosidase